MPAILHRALLAVIFVSAGLAHDGHAAGMQVPGKSLVIRADRLTKFLAKPAPATTFPLPAPGGAADPTVADGSFSVVDGADATRTFIADLPKAQWQGLGSPAGSRGYKYKGAGTVDDPCRIVLVKGTVLKAVCKDDQSLAPPLLGAPAAKIRVGADSYSSLFGAAPVKNQAGLYRASGAPSCTPPPACCGGLGFHAFTTADAAGDCGDVVQSNGAPYGAHPDLRCGGLYFGGGGNSVPLPLRFPDREQSVTAITSCLGQTATLGPTTSTDTGSNRNCTAPGCLFGPPIPLPNADSPPVSTCVVYSVAGATSGTLDCATGAQQLSLPLSAEVYLTGDSVTDPGNSIPGVQPCPLCSGGTCIGGPNNGLACVPAAGSGSTSHDCPPDPMFDIGPVSSGFALTSGTVTWIATPVTNDTEVEFNMTRVFTGFCRDTDVTLAFQGDPILLPGPPQKCWENGAPVGAPCAQPAETCEQRNNGAFGPNGGAVKTITATGLPQDGLLCGASTGVLASLFAIPPTFDATVDAAADLPGPAAVTIPVAGALCATAATCPLSGPCGDGICGPFDNCSNCPADCAPCPPTTTSSTTPTSTSTTITAPTGLRAFITNGAWNGAQIGGLEGADAKCQAEADSASLLGFYRAWMSDSFTAAGVRLTHGATPYVMPEGTQIADDWTDLTDGTIDAPLTKKADGTDRGLGGAWTATSPSGAISYPSNTCTDWTSTSGLGADGYSGATNGDWSTNSVQPLDFCSVQSPLYCFEQLPCGDSAYPTCNGGCPPGLECGDFGSCLCAVP